MMKNNISAIITKYLFGRFSPETEKKVQKWLIKDENLEEKESASLEYWDSLEAAPSSKTYSALERVNKRIGQSNKRAVRTPLYRKLNRIAAVLIPMSIIGGGYLYYQSNQNNMIEIHVAYGEEKHLFLPDSSEIWINAGSTIKYPKEFNADKRIVELDGEAYFSVRRDELKPFTVSTDKLSVNVLGTKFNVKAYSSEGQITTMLTSGKIEVKSKKQSQILKPNEQLSFDKKTSTINIIEVSSSETVAWKSGQLIFADASLSDILNTLERKFNTSFESSKLDLSADKKYTVKFNQNENLDEILTILKEIIGFSYEKESDKIIISEHNSI